MSSTFVVDDDGAQCPAAAYTTINAAVAAASSGDIVQVCAGSYAESVSTTKSLTFLGAKSGVDGRTGRTDPSQESIVDNAAPFVFNGVTGTVTLDGFTITGSTNGNGDGTAVLLLGGSGHSIANNIFVDDERAAFWNSSGTTASHNRLDTSGDGFFIGSGDGDDSTIESNLFTGSGNDGVVVVPSAATTGLVIHGNTATGTENFAVLFSTEDAEVSGNTVTNSVSSAMYIGGGNSGTTISGNTITGGGGSAVSINNAFGPGPNSGVVVESNELRGKATGVNIPSGGASDATEIHFNRLDGLTTAGVNNASGHTADATNNWWGCNEGPTLVTGDCSAVSGANVDADPWLVLTLDSSDSTLLVGETATLTSAITQNSDGADTTASGTILDGEGVSFASDRGTVSPTSTTLVNGVATSTLTAATIGNGTASATVDNETVTTPIEVFGGRGVPTVRVEFADAPNAFGSPSFGTPTPTGTSWTSNAARGMLLDVATQGTAGQPTYFQTETNYVSQDIVVTGFNSWQGVANPGAPYQNELGQRLHGVNSIKAPAGKTVDIANGVTRSWVDSGDPGNTGTGLGFDATTTTAYSAGRFIGVRYGTDGQPGTADDVYLTSGTGPVNEIIGFSPGNAYEPDVCQNPPCTNQDLIDETLDFIQERAPWTNTVTVTYGSGGSAASGSGSSDINTPQFSVSPSAPATEGTTRTIVVTASVPSLIPMTVHYATGGGSATAGQDYTATSGTLTFAAGQTQKSFTVSTNDDNIDEANETFKVTLSNPDAATIAAGSATSTVLDNDANPVATVADIQVSEGTGAGSTVATFTVKLDRPASRARNVDYATGGGSATAGADYTPVSGMLTFAPGQTSKTVDVTVTRDSLNEANETFDLLLSKAASSPRAAIGDGVAVATIVDDDGPPSISIRDSGITEGNSGIHNMAFVVRLGRASGKTITVKFTSADGSAMTPSDYVAKTGTVTFAPGETTKTITIGVKGDTVKEPNETVFVNLFQATNAGIADPNGSGVIRDDD